jgi:transcription antitermination factor NusA-like protein
MKPVTAYFGMTKLMIEPGINRAINTAISPEKVDEISVDEDDSEAAMVFLSNKS